MILFYMIYLLILAYEVWFLCFSLKRKQGVAAAAALTALNAAMLALLILKAGF